MSHSASKMTSASDHSAKDVDTPLDLNTNSEARIKNPLSGISRANLLWDVEYFAKQKDLAHALPILIKGAVRKL